MRNPGILFLILISPLFSKGDKKIMTLFLILICFSPPFSKGVGGIMLLTLSLICFWFWFTFHPLSQRGLGGFRFWFCLWFVFVFDLLFTPFLKGGWGDSAFDFVFDLNGNGNKWVSEWMNEWMTIKMSWIPALGPVWRFSGDGHERGLFLFRGPVKFRFRF